MNLNRPNMTEDVKSKDYTNKFLQTGSNPVTMEASGIVVPCEFSVRNLKRFLTKLRTIPLPQNLLTRPKQPRTMPLFTADGRGTISVSKTMQRANKDALEKLDPNQVYHTFPDRREGSKSSLILKKPKTKKSNRVLYMTKPLKEELLAWLEKLKQDEQNAPEKYSNCGQLFRLPDGLPIAPELLTKWYRLWRAEHPEFEQIVFHGLRHSSATYQLMISVGDVKAAQGTTGHATADMLVNTYAHIQQSSRVELGKKFEEGFYAKSESPSPQAVPAAGEPTISMTALLELLKNADPEVKAQLRLALLT